MSVPPTTGGMTGGQMAAMGGVAMLGGGLLDYYGQTEGAKAAEREAKRQAAEQDAMLQARHAAYMQALGRVNPAQGGAVAGQQATMRMNAAAPTLAAGGQALGLNSGQVAGVGRALLPVQIAGGQRDAQGIMRQRTAENVTQLGNEQGDIDAAMRGAAALYPMRDEIAKMTGAEYRTGGQMLSGVGMPLLVAGMNQAPVESPAEEVRWGNPNAPKDGGGFTPVGIRNGVALPTSAEQGAALYDVFNRAPTPRTIPVEGFDMRQGAGAFSVPARRPTPRASRS